MKKLMFVLFALLLVAGVSFGQLNQGTYAFDVTAATSGLEVGSDGAVTVTGLVPGTCYEIVPDLQNTQTILPIINEEAAEIVPTSITADPLADIVISCALPSMLTNTEVGPLSLTYNGTSAMVVTGAAEFGAFFNPTSGPFAVNAGDGAVTLSIGFNTCVPKTALVSEAQWVGTGVITVQYK